MGPRRPGGPVPHVAPIYRITATALGASMWFWIMYRTKKDGMILDAPPTTANFLPPPNRSGDGTLPWLVPVPSLPSSDAVEASSAASATHRAMVCMAQDAIRCMTCATDLALASQIVSKGFTGQHGRALLVVPTPPTDATSTATPATLANIRVGRSEKRQLVTGWHVVADISCATCSRKLGWKYVDAQEPSQRYKIGKYILEVERVVIHRLWDDGAGDDIWDGQEPADHLPAAASGATDHNPDEVVFDSNDEDECEDLFAGVWDAAMVDKRHSHTLSKRMPSSTDAA